LFYTIGHLGYICFIGFLVIIIQIDKESVIQKSINNE
jgi:hypothetical protein